MVLTFSCIMLKDWPNILLKSCSVKTVEFLNCVWPFFNIIRKRVKDISIRGKFWTQNPAILILKVLMLQNLSGNTGIEITTGDRWKSVAIDKTGEGSKVFSIEKKKKKNPVRNQHKGREKHLLRKPWLQCH